MSAPPGTTNPAPANTNTYIMAGAIAGIIVLCGGLFANSMITLNIVTRNADYAFKPGATQPGTVDNRPETKPDREGPVDDNQGAAQVARGFMSDLKVGDYGKAWNRGSDRFKNDEDSSEFRKRLESQRIFKGYNALSMSRTIGGAAGVATFRGTVKGGTGEARFVLEITQEDDGSWRVDSFAKE